MDALAPVVAGASILKGKRGEASTLAAQLLYHPSG
jgi:hypothetical protein